MRLHATLLLQPYSKKRLTPQALMPFPWEKAAAAPERAEKMSRADHIKRAAELMESLQTKDTDR